MGVNGNYSKLIMDGENLLSISHRLCANVAVQVAVCRTTCQWQWYSHIQAAAGIVP